VVGVDEGLGGQAAPSASSSPAGRSEQYLLSLWAPVRKYSGQPLLWRLREAAQRIRATQNVMHSQRITQDENYGSSLRASLRRLG
jgi:hypothetical protein